MLIGYSNVTYSDNNSSVMQGNACNLVEYTLAHMEKLYNWNFYSHLIFVIFALPMIMSKYNPLNEYQINIWFSLSG